jgi:DedD protein
MQWHKGTEFQVVNQGQDREVTLGPMMLTVLGLSLLVVCCICFLAGYAIGHRSGSATPASSTASTASGRSAAEILAQSQAAHPPASVPASVSHHSEPEIAAPKLSRTASDETEDPPQQPRATTQSPTPQPVSTVQSVQSAVHPALSQAIAQAGAWVVQVAAVENSQDADVLVSALRRRGYSVSARHDPGDNLLHVQVGPFASRGDADSMRQRLLNDGYNAIVEQ